jgi:hypothetical protein
MARPLKTAEPGGQVTIGLRVPTELKSQLEAAAAGQDRNLSQECERRLRRSFDPNDLVDDAVHAVFGEDGRERDARRTHELAERALTLLCGQEAAEVGALLACAVAFVRHAKRAGHGKVQIDKEGVDRIKAALRELERE